MPNYGLQDKVALITGANNPQGIGATTTFAFAREGAKVVLVYKKSTEHLTKLKSIKTELIAISPPMQAMRMRWKVNSKKWVRTILLLKVIFQTKMLLKIFTRKLSPNTARWIFSSTTRRTAIWTASIPSNKSPKTSLTIPLR